MVAFQLVKQSRGGRPKWGFSFIILYYRQQQAYMTVLEYILFLYTCFNIWQTLTENVID